MQVLLFFNFKHSNIDNCFLFCVFQQDVYGNFMVYKFFLFFFYFGIFFLNCCFDVCKCFFFGVQLIFSFFFHGVGVCVVATIN